MPTNPMGPQNAVTVPVIRQQLNNAFILIFCGLAPESEANSSPKSMMSRPLLSESAIADPRARAIAMMQISLMDVVEKLPADQLWNIFRLSASLPD